MMYLGDYLAGTTVDFMWSTNGADGASITRATNGTVSVYKANNTTQTTTGVTDTEDFDSLTGIHHCRIATSDAFYATGNDYMVVLSGATIDGKSVNAVLALFSIENRNTKANLTHISGSAVSTSTAQLGVNVVQLSGDGTAADNAEAFFDGTGYAGTNNVIPTVTTVNGLAANVITAASMAADAGAEIADAVWDEALSGHTTAGTAGKGLSDAGAAGDPWSTALPGAYGSGTAGKILGDKAFNASQIGGSTTAATAAGKAFQGIVTGTAVTGTLSTTQFTTNLTEATNDHYNGRTVTFISGALAGQQATITDYNGSTKALTVAAMTEAPANGDEFFIA